MTDQDTVPAELVAQLAEITGLSVEEAAAMTKDQIIDWTARCSFRNFGLLLGIRHDEHLMDEGPRQQGEHAAEQLERFHDRVAKLFPVRDHEIDLFGFGRAPVHFVTFDADGKADEQYLLLSEVAEALGVPLHKAEEWARRDHLDAIRSQRETDEKRGALGWECLADLVDLELSMVVDDPEAKPDADGKRWSHAGDWLISRDRLLAFMTISPWNKEFLDNAGPLFGFAFRETMGDKLKEIATYRADGTPTGSTAYEDLARTDGLTVEEAAARAIRGPSLGGEDAEL